ncbi:MAG TPA: TetR/AcrR family transcriptional regulator [Actinomycetota bacterium]|nr:TetR/AcrR family transcriptional regulator [Actinomycetota bacterium]
MSDRTRLGAEARRELIVSAAVRLFAERGFHGVSLDEIAAEAGVTKPVLYDHAVSKIDLYSGLLEREHDELVAYVAEHVEGGTVEERATSALRTLFDWAQDRPCSWRLLFDDDVTGDPHVASLHAAVRMRVNLEVAVRLLAATPAESRDPLEVEMVGAVVGGAARSLVRWWCDHPGVPKERVVEAAAGVVSHGLRGRGPGRARRRHRAAPVDRVERDAGWEP